MGLPKLEGRLNFWHSNWEGQKSWVSKIGVPFHAFAILGLQFWRAKILAPKLDGKFSLQFGCQQKLELFQDHHKQFGESLVVEKQSNGLYSVKTFGGPKDWVSKFGGPTQILALQIGGPKNRVSKFGGATQILALQNGGARKLDLQVWSANPKKKLCILFCRAAKNSENFGSNSD
jgi:hypothetical protein